MTDVIISPMGQPIADVTRDRGSYRRELAMLVVSVLVSLLLLEALVRALPVRETRYPVLTGRRQGGPINALGYRDTEHDPARRPGVRRALFIGDSFTFGGGVLLEDGFPKRVERRLERFRKEAWESVVMAKPGLNTVDEALIFERDGVAFHPDILVLGYVLNDAETTDSAERRRASEWVEAEREKVTSWWSHSALIRLGRDRLRSTVENRARIRNYQSLFTAGAPGFIESQKALVRIGELAKRENLPFIVAIFPLFANPLDDAYPFFEAHRQVAEAARVAGAQPLDLFPSYRNLDWTHLVVNGAADEHPNEIAHRIAAEAIAETIDRLLPPPPVRPENKRD
jgi:hypothetical protein